MKIYYFSYQDGDTRFQFEAFASAVKAKARLGELKRKDKEIRDAWKAYTIAKYTPLPLPKPTARPGKLPQQVSEFEFHNNGKQALLTMFERAVRIGRGLSDAS